MVISGILPVISDKLFQVVFDDNKEMILDRLQEQWSDLEWLRRFFKKFERDLQLIEEPFTINKAIKQTVTDADNLFETLYEENGINLSSFFRPLDNREEEVRDNQKQKGRIKRPRTWLRLYAVHFNGKYIITGGAIKLTKGMNRSHLKDELFKLDVLRRKLNVDTNSNSIGYLEL
jgi:hypothetical protein